MSKRGGRQVASRPASRVSLAEIGFVCEGIYGARSDGCRIEGNEVVGPGGSEQASGNAIQLWSTREAVVRDNLVTGHRDGIYLEFVTATRLEGNRSEANRRYGLHFMFSDSCDYRDNRFEANGAGVAVMYSRRVRMEGNTFSGHRGAAAYGLLLKDLVDSELDGNQFTDNTTALFSPVANFTTAPAGGSAAGQAHLVDRQPATRQQLRLGAAVLGRAFAVGDADQAQAVAAGFLRVEGGGAQIQEHVGAADPLGHVPPRNAEESDMPPSLRR